MRKMMKRKLFFVKEKKGFYNSVKLLLIVLHLLT